MDAFSLLRYWRGGGGPVTLGGAGNARTVTCSTRTTVIAAASDRASETEQEDGDDGPFFDLEFSIPENNEDGGDDRHRLDDKNGGIRFSDDSENETEEVGVESDGSDDENGRDFKITLSSDYSGGSSDPNSSLAPSDDLFIKGRLVPIEPSSLVFSGSETLSKSQFPACLLKSATKFRVLILKFRKSTPNASEKPESNGLTATPQQKEQIQNREEKHNQCHSKLLTVKLKFEDVPIVSFFTRDNSSRATNRKVQKQNSEESASDDKKFSKDVMQRYLKMVVKPLYVRVSKRYGDKLKFSGQISTLAGTKSSPSPPSAVVQKPPAVQSAVKSETETGTEVDSSPQSYAKNQKQGNLAAGLRVACKHLEKSRSASSAMSPTTSTTAGPSSSRRRDDSLLQQQDGIQSAILHCKRSFNSS